MLLTAATERLLLLLLNEEALYERCSSCEMVVRSNKVVGEVSRRELQHVDDIAEHEGEKVLVGKDGRVV